MPLERPPSPRTSQTAQRSGRNRRPSAALAGALRLMMTIGASAALVGCAAPGEPTARHPVVPQAVQDLAVRQEGDGVELSFTLPIGSTDKKPLAEPPALEIYRVAPAAGGPAGAKATMRLVDTVPSDIVPTYEENGHIEFRDRLDPNELARTPGQQVSYMVRTRVSRQRASADSALASLRIYPAPEPVGELRAAVIEKGVMLTWAAPASPGGAGYRIYRAEVEPESAAAGTEDLSKAVLRGPFNAIGLVPQPAYADTGIELGHSYVYKVRSVAQFGSDSVESTDSNAVAATAKDVFAPAAPQGVVAVAIPETAGMPAYVELSWAISPEADLAGYAIYRSEQPETPGERLNSELLPAPTFRDTNVVSGRRYFYQVRAVDHAGNESPLSAVVEVEVAGR
jgi:hypothetical protein